MTDRDDALADHPGTASRRAVILGAGAVGAASLLAACGDDTPPATAPQAPPAPPEQGGNPPGEGSAMGDIAVTDVPVGSGIIVQARNAIVTQPAAGEFMGFSSTCTHMQCTLASVVNDKINCSCHNSQFSIVDGSVLRGPATEALPTKGVTVEGDRIFID
jgi:nitrite reductase/ring-hydroxylating ferredoxin subunit